jgi:hypothetical protein
MRRGAFFWGVVLVVVGMVLLLDNLGLLGNLNVWPLLWSGFLIIAGAWMLVGHFFRKKLTSEHASVPLDGAGRAIVRFQHGAGRLGVHPLDSPTELVSGDFAGGVEVSNRVESDARRVTLAVPTHIFPFDWLPGETLDWSVGLNRSTPLELEFQTGANESILDLTDLLVTRLRLESGASNTSINLPRAAGQTSVHVEAGAAQVSIVVPQGVAARIRTEGGAMGSNIDTVRFPRSGSAYQSPDYETAANRADIHVQMGAGSVQVS